MIDKLSKTLKSGAAFILNRIVGRRPQITHFRHRSAIAFGLVLAG
jgi:hypothetical protein